MIFPPDGYRPHDDFIAAARQSAALWRTVAGAILIAIVYVALSYGLVLYLAGRYGDLIGGAVVAAMFAGRTPAMMVLLLFSFLTLAVGPVLAVRALHRRRAGSLFGPVRTVLGDFRAAMLASLATGLLALPFQMSGTEPGLPATALILWLPLALLAVLVQTGAEELVFRGYLQQQLAARFRSPAIWMAAPSLLFAWGHYAPTTFGTNALPVALWSAAFGLYAADLTARTGSLGAAVGFHFANNLAAFLLVSVKGDMDGLALWTLPVDLTDPDAVRPLILTDFATMTVGWLAARLALRV